MNMKPSRWFLNNKFVFTHLGRQAVKGSSEPKLLDYTFHRLLRSLSDEFSDRDAIISTHQNDKRVSYKQFDHLSSILASRLYESGVRKGDRVAVCAGNIWQYPIIQFGLGRLGAIMVPLNPAFKINQFERALSTSKTSTLIIQDSLYGGRENQRKDMSQLIRLFGNDNRVFIIPSNSSSIAEEFGDNHFDQLLEGSPDSYLLQTFSDEQNNHDIINMQLTSGTTSDPKISCLTHDNVINNGYLISNRMGLTSKDKMCVPVPMFHCFGLVLSNMAAYIAGASTVYPSESFNAVDTLRAVREQECTVLQGVPTMFAAEFELRDEINKGGLKQLRTGIAAGSSVPIEIMKSLFDKFGMDGITICYGMTETSPVSFMSFPTDSVEDRVKTCGSIMPHTEARIVDPNDDSVDPLPFGQAGEIVVSGYLLQKCYYNEPQKTREVMVTDSNGVTWMRTGDEGIINEDGNMRVTGRIKDLIIRGGENIHPLEIEEIMFQHPAISQASVVGVPDEKYGEQIAAFVILHEAYEKIPSEEMTDDIQKHIDKNLGHFMIPKYMYYVKDFPKTASGKIRKVDLRLLHGEK